MRRLLQTNFLRDLFILEPSYNLDYDQTPRFILCYLGLASYQRHLGVLWRLKSVHPVGIPTFNMILKKTPCPLEAGNFYRQIIGKLQIDSEVVY